MDLRDHDSPAGSGVRGVQAPGRRRATRRPAAEGQPVDARSDTTAAAVTAGEIDGGTVRASHSTRNRPGLEFDWNSCSRVRGPSDNPPPWPLWRNTCGKMKVSVTFDPQASSTPSWAVMRDLADTRRDDRLLRCLSAAELADDEHGREWNILVAVAPDGQVTFVSAGASHWVPHLDGLSPDADVVEPAHRLCFERELRGLRVRAPSTGAARIMWKLGIWKVRDNPFDQADDPRYAP
jgi:hypothetical protein